MLRKLQDLLQDIAVRSVRIRSYIDGKTRRNFLETQLQDSVERNLLVVGEALSQAVKISPALVWKISDTRKIVAFRHLLAHHDYRVISGNCLGRHCPQPNAA